MITLNAVSLGYESSLKVLDQVNLQVPKGEFLYLLGGTGAGKTSLLRLISTEEKPDSGMVSLFGYPLHQSPARVIRDIRRAIGYISQKNSLIADLDVLSNLELSIESLGVSNEEKLRFMTEAKEMLHSLGLAQRMKVKAGVLSGGESQRVSIVRALARNPQILLADEPTGAQDREQTWSIMDLFVKANLRGTTVLLATHDRDIVRRVRKKCAVLKNGHVTLGDGACIY